MHLSHSTEPASALPEFCTGDDMAIVDFATFCHEGDGHRLHKPGHLQMMVESNGYDFEHVLIVHQLCLPYDFDNPLFNDYGHFGISLHVINDLDWILSKFRIDLTKPQYVSDVDRVHTWKNHVVNHLVAVYHSNAEYIVFADSDCWMIKQPSSWVELGIRLLESNRDIFIVSPNDGEPERRTQVMSQQMFLVRVEDFRQADFNQPGWDGNPHVPGGPFPEYWALLEGRMELYCRHVNRYRYVLPPEYRYWHFNRTTQDGMLEMDMSKY